MSASTPAFERLDAIRWTHRPADTVCPFDDSLTISGTALGPAEHIHSLEDIGTLCVAYDAVQHAILVGQAEEIAHLYRGSR